MILSLFPVERVPNVDVVLAVQCNYEKNYAFVEVVTVLPVESMGYLRFFFTVPQC